MNSMSLCLMLKEMFCHKILPWTMRFRLQASSKGTSGRDTMGNDSCHRCTQFMQSGAQHLDIWFDIYVLVCCVGARTTHSLRSFSWRVVTTEQCIVRAELLNSEVRAVLAACIVEALQVHTDGVCPRAVFTMFLPVSDMCL